MIRIEEKSPCHRLKCLLASFIIIISHRSLSLTPDSDFDALRFFFYESEHVHLASLFFHRSSNNTTRPFTYALWKTLLMRSGQKLHGDPFGPYATPRYRSPNSLHLAIGFYASLFSLSPSRASINFVDTSAGLRGGREKRQMTIDFKRGETGKTSGCCASQSVCIGFVVL